MTADKNKTPLVSVIMPAYNAEKYIRAAIESVIRQTYENWELIVLDDGSTDSTAQTVKRMAEGDSRIRFCPNERNMGVAATRNRGFDLARGDYVALLDSDDVWLPQKLEKQLALAAGTKADIIYTSYYIIDKNGDKSRDDYIVPAETSFESMLEENHIGCSTAMLEKSIVKKYRFDGSYAHEDYVLWLQLLEAGYSAAGLTEPLVKYRFHAGSRASDKLNAAKNRWSIYRKYLKLPLGKSIVSLARYAMAGVRKYRR